MSQRHVVLGWYSGLSNSPGIHPHAHAEGLKGECSATLLRVTVSRAVSKSVGQKSFILRGKTRYCPRNLSLLPDYSVVKASVMCSRSLAGSQRAVQC